MEINKSLIKTLSEAKLQIDDSLTFLLALHFNLRPQSFKDKEELMIKLQYFGIIEVKDKEIIWKIPLFKGQEVAFNWVTTEYCKLFEDAGKNSYNREAVSRMKKLFANNPEIRKDEVINATVMYLNNTDKKFVKFPHYFIEKGVGANKEQTILTWIDKARVANEQYNRSQDNLLQ